MDTCPSAARGRSPRPQHCDRSPWQRRGTAPLRPSGVSRSEPGPVDSWDQACLLQPPLAVHSRLCQGLGGWELLEALEAWACFQDPSSSPPLVLPVAFGAATWSQNSVWMLPPDSQGVCIYIPFTPVFRAPCPLPGPEVRLSTHPSSSTPSPCPPRTAHRGGVNCPAPFAECPSPAQALPGTFPSYVWDPHHAGSRSQNRGEAGPGLPEHPRTNAVQ